MSQPAPVLLTSLLRDVSRSFYLTLRVLPGSVRPQIGLAYLLARTTDTIADTSLVPVADRQRALEQLRERILGKTTTRLDFNAFLSAQSTSPNAPATAAEKVLLGRVEEALQVLAAQPVADRELIRTVLETITNGQQLDLQRFGSATAGRLVALETSAELEEYTYLVAGCVGEFWSRMCRRHVFPADALDEAVLLALGIRYGKGLQLVNILRDLPRDLREGRCYLPGEQLRAGRLTPEDLLDPSRENALRPIYQPWLLRAQEYLSAGWKYTNLVPWRCLRVRLACAWPILIGGKTLEKLQTSPILDPKVRLKVGRAEVRQIMLRSMMWYPWPKAWRRLFTP